MENKKIFEEKFRKEGGQEILTLAGKWSDGIAYL